MSLMQQTSTFISGYRRSKRGPAGTFGFDPQDEAEAAADPLRLPVRSAEAEALDRLADCDIMAALRDLPESFRVAVCLADVEGCTYREIAELTGVPVGTVMSRLHRGRARLRRKLTISPRPGTASAS